MVLLFHLKPEVINITRALILEDAKLEKYMSLFDKEITRAQAKETCEESSVKSIITHVNKLPSGNEEGLFLGLDFSGPIIRVMLGQLENKKCFVKNREFEIPEKYRTGKSVRLFDFIAKCLVKFLKDIKLNLLRIPLGVTFGFPTEQTSLQDCKLLRWTQDFSCNDLYEKNIFTLLKNSIRKFPELKRLYVIGIISDAVSAILANAWQEPLCKVGAVIGFEVSLCYAEKVHRVTKYEAEHYGITDIYMNLETSNLGSDGVLEFLQTEFDKQVDEESVNPGAQINNKLTSMVYFGEIARKILLKCVEFNIILKGVISKQLSKKNSLTIYHMMKIEEDPDTSHENCRAVLKSLGYHDVTDVDCFQVQFICRCVARRSANLIAAQLTAIIHRINSPLISIVIDGELIKNYPRFQLYLFRKISLLKKEDLQFQLSNASDNNLGPIVMAALFGKEVMDRDEKLRRLPGFPMDNCHFRKKQKCMNPDCNATKPCDSINKLTQPMTTNDDDLMCCKDYEAKESSETKAEPKGKDKCDKCRGYREM